jgi:hypothetical protein
MPFIKKSFCPFLLIFINLMLCAPLQSQEVTQAINNYGIYEFLDELANLQIIEINSVVKPYSRLFIANQLKLAKEKKELLNKRQSDELEFYLLDFGKEVDDAARRALVTEIRAQKTGPRSGESVLTEVGREGEIQWLLKKNGLTRRDLFYYKDPLFSLTVNPILGGEIFTNKSGKATYWRNGLEARGYIGNWGFYASLRDNHETPLLGLPQYLSQRTDGHMKEGNSWEEMKGGISYAWSWGSAGLVKDNIQWGNNYNGANIFRGNDPTFVQLQLHINPVKWFDFNYFHGWLNSMVVDSARSYWVSNSYGRNYREVYHKKFIAANIFTITPFRNLKVSAGNSIIYADLDLFPAYLIPVFFYKAVDHSVNSGIDNMNSQMFFDISSRQIKNLHLYATLFVDELSVSRIRQNPKTEWNFLSYKAGFRLTDFPLSNLSFTTEFTYTYPLTFQHYVPTLSFESNGYNLGHYLRDNSREWYLSLNYRPVRTMDISLSFLDAVRGPDYSELGGSRLGNPPLDSIKWHNTTYCLKASYQIINDVYTWVSFAVSDISGDMRWSPEYFFGRKNTFNFGVTVGF